jgi:hypothetical protein
VFQLSFVDLFCRDTQPAAIERIRQALSPNEGLVELLEAGVDVRFADLPMIEGATGKFLLQQMAAVAELEAGMISARSGERRKNGLNTCRGQPEFHQPNWVSATRSALPTVL